METQKTNNEQWHKIGIRDNLTPFFNLISLGIYDENCENILGFPLGVNAFRNHNREIGYKLDEFQKGEHIIANELRVRGPAYFITLADKLDALGRELVSFCQETATRTYVSEEMLCADIETVMSKARAYSPALALVNGIEPVIENELREMIHRALADEKSREDAFQIFTTSERIDETEYELDEIRTLQMEMKAGGITSPDDPRIAPAIREHLEKWKWIFVGRSGEKDDVLAIMKDRLRKDIATQSIHDKKDAVRIETQQWLARTGIDEEYVDLVKMYVYFRTHRMNLFLQSSYYLTELLAQAAHILHMPFDLVQQMSFQEILAALKTGDMPDMQELQARI